MESAIIYYRQLQDIFSQESYDEIEDDINDILRSFIVKESQLSLDIAIRLGVADAIEAQKHFFFFLISTK